MKSFMVDLFFVFQKNFQMVDFSNLLSQTGLVKLFLKINFDIYYSDVFSLLDDIRMQVKIFQKMLKKK